MNLISMKKRRIEVFHQYIVAFVFVSYDCVNTHIWFILFQGLPDAKPINLPNSSSSSPTSINKLIRSIFTSTVHYLENLITHNTKPNQTDKSDTEGDVQVVSDGLSDDNVNKVDYDSDWSKQNSR